MKKNKRCAIFLFFSSLFIVAKGQESGSVFNFIKIPVSAHSAALGGVNISLIEDDPTLTFDNPALLASVADRTLNLNYMTYISGSKLASASFVKMFGDRHTFGVNARYLDYGTIDQTTESSDAEGTFSAKDIAVSGLYSYSLSEKLVGGATAKVLYSKYAEYSSLAACVDLGINYFNEDTDFSLSMVLKNIGTQFSSFNGDSEHLPFDWQIGFTQGIAHAPLRISVTMVDLTRWSSDYYYNPNGDDKFSKKFFNHFVVGADILPSSQTYLSVGYNFRRASELKAAGSAHGAGWSFGGGLQLTRLKLGVSYAKYHLSTSSLLFNISYVL